MKNKGKLSKRTLGLLAATLVLVLATGGMGARAALSIFSQDYNAEFELDHLNVALLENGEIAAETNPGDKIKVVNGGKLLAHGHDDDGLAAGRLEPGRVYKEEIAARNMRDIDEYVRLSIRTYWCVADTEDNGEPVLDENGDPVYVKDTELDPSLIELYYVDSDGSKSNYNTSAWKINSAETTTERKVYYLTDVLPKGKDSPLLVNKLRVSDQIISDVTIETEVDEKTDHTTYRYIYKYDGRLACIEADVQSIQTHNSEDAVKSLWGVPNVNASDRKITVTD